MTKGAQMQAGSGTLAAVARAKKGAREGSTSQISLRVEDELIARADALTDREKLTKGPFSLDYVRASRADVLRAAIIIGLEQLERDHGLRDDE